MKKLIIFLLILSSCVKTVPRNEEEASLPVISVDGRPVRIIPDLSVKNTKVEDIKDLWIKPKVREICDKAKKGDFEQLVELSFDNLSELEKNALSEAISKYNDGIESSYLLTLGKIKKLDYRNNGYEKIMISFNTSYTKLKQTEDGETIYFPYDYGFFTVFLGKNLKEIVKGDELSYYYQDAKGSFQDFVKIEGKNYLASFSSSNKIKRLDEINLVKGKNFNHILCEF